MTEQTETPAGVEYSETCGAGSCDRPATVLVHEHFVLCALHYLRFKTGQGQNEASLTLELISGWHDYLIQMFNIASEELQGLVAEAARYPARAHRPRVQGQRGD